LAKFAACGLRRQKSADKAMASAVFCEAKFLACHAEPDQQKPIIWRPAPVGH